MKSHEEKASYLEEVARARRSMDLNSRIRCDSRVVDYVTANTETQKEANTYLRFYRQECGK